MSEQFNALAEFEKLLQTFSRDLASATALQSPNAEDTLEIRSAIVGFSYHSPTEKWEINHYNYVSEHIKASRLEGRELTFSCLRCGYLLGLFESNKITEKQFKLAEVQLPGFILLQGGKI